MKLTQILGTIRQISDIFVPKIWGLQLVSFSFYHKNKIGTIYRGPPCTYDFKISNLPYLTPYGTLRWPYLTLIPGESVKTLPNCYIMEENTLSNGFVGWEQVGKSIF